MCNHVQTSFFPTKFVNPILPKTRKFSYTQFFSACDGWQVDSQQNGSSHEQVTISCQVNQMYWDSKIPKISAKRTRALPNQIHQPKSFNLTWKRKYFVFTLQTKKKIYIHIIIKPGLSNCQTANLVAVHYLLMSKPSFQSQLHRYTPENKRMSPKKGTTSVRFLHLPTSNHPFSGIFVARFQGFQLLISSDPKRRCGEVFPMYLFQCEDQLSQLTTWANWDPIFPPEGGGSKPLHPGRFERRVHLQPWAPWKERKMSWTKPPGNYVPC